MQKKSIALFDFDGTISKSDSLLLFLKFYFSKSAFVKLMSRFVTVYAKFKFGLIDNSRAKERLFGIAFAGEDFNQFDKKCKEFYEKVLKNDLRKSALTKVDEHLRNGDRVVLVSASVENYLLPFCEEFKMELISTKLEVEEDKLTGRFATPNCYGEEKVKRIRASIDLAEYEKIFVYGDSRGDNEMMELATHPFYRELN